MGLKIDNNFENDNEIIDDEFDDVVETETPVEADKAATSTMTTSTTKTTTSRRHRNCVAVGFASPFGLSQLQLSSLHLSKS